MSKKTNPSILPAVGLGVAAAATMGVGLAMAQPRNKKKVQAAAGRALKAVGEVVENFSGSMKL